MFSLFMGDKSNAIEAALYRIDDPKQKKNYNKDVERRLSGSCLWDSVHHEAIDELDVEEASIA